MKTNPNDLINQLPLYSESENHNKIERVSGGLTKREYFASMMLQGILAGRQLPLEASDLLYAEEAIMLADNLIDELNKE